MIPIHEWTLFHIENGNENMLFPTSKTMQENLHSIFSTLISNWCTQC